MAKLTCLCLSAALGALAFFTQPARADDFSTKFHEGCVSSAIASVEQQGVKADADFQKKVNAYCDCGLAHIQGQFTASELLSLSSPNPDPAVVARIKPLMLQCYKENFQQ